MSIANPSGSFLPSSTIVLRSEPSGFAVSTRPPAISRKKMRPVMMSFLFCVLVDFVSVALICHISLVCLFGSWKSFACLGAKRQEAQHHVVLFVGQLLDRQAARQLHHAIDDGLLEYGRDVGHLQTFHQALKPRHQVLHEVLDAARPSAQMPLQALA